MKINFSDRVIILSFMIILVTFSPELEIKNKSRSSGITNQVHHIKIIIKLISVKEVLMPKVTEAFKLHEFQMLLKNIQKQLSN